MGTQTILVVDDDMDIREGIRILLRGENYTILEAASGQQALDQLSSTVGLVILDIMMPGMSGLRVCEEIRKISTVPILFLTAKAQETDKLVGLTAGGDDYLTKPFSYAELIARVKALLRRYCVYRGKVQEGTEERFLSLRGVRLNLDHNQVWVREKEVELTEIEYQILRLLMRTPQRIFSIQSIYETVWDEPYFYISNGTVMVHIRKLRVKIEEDPQEPKYIKNVWGKGYRFEGSGNEGG
jgi:DNA-binding response OmpR family regulator